MELVRRIAIEPVVELDDICIFGISGKLVSSSIEAENQPLWDSSLHLQYVAMALLGGEGVRAKLSRVGFRLFEAGGGTCSRRHLEKWSLSRKRESEENSCRGHEVVSSRWRGLGLLGIANFCRQREPCLECHLGDIGVAIVWLDRDYERYKLA